MNEIEKARQQINEADKIMAAAFEKRMEAMKGVAKYKIEHGMPIFDAAREAEVIEKNSAQIKNGEIRSYYVSFITDVMEISKAYQHKLAEGENVAYSGVGGAFANMAAEEIFPGCNAVSCSSFTTAYENVKNGECESAVLPIENSFAGDVGAVMDLAYFGGLYISGVYEFDITQNLLAAEGTRLEDIKEVISHPQALSQSGKYIKSHGFKAVEAENTAVAAKFVCESGRKDLAAIGSAKAAELYGLKILEGHINDSGKNTTRFAVFTRDKKEISPADDHFIMVFTVNNKTGSLCGALSIIGESGFNLVSLKSRPTKDLVWDNYFFVEGEGNLGTEEGRKMLASLGKYCNTFKVLGNFARKNLSR